MNQQTPLSFSAFIAALSGVAILWLPVLTLHLTIVLFTVLTVYAATHALAQQLRRFISPARHTEIPALLLILLLFIILLYTFGDWLGDKTHGHTLSDLMTQTATILDRLHDKLPASIAGYIPVSVESLKELLSQTLKEHAMQLKNAGMHTLRSIGYLFAGMVIGGFAAIRIPPVAPTAAKPLAALLRREFEQLLHAFTDVFFAQLRISAINTVLTSLYLLGILPLLGKPLPMTGTLIAATFFIGLIPVIGNIISNTFIVILSLGDSIGVTLMSLFWLISIHKLEYFLNAQIIGHKIKAAAWELLTTMLISESVFGLAGLISAPVIYAQIKKILSRKDWV